MRRATFFSCLLISLAGVWGNAPAAENWPAWRGITNAGTAGADGHYPTNLAPEKALWTARLSGKGCSTPISWDDRLYVTAPTNDLDSACCFDWNGTLLWQTTFGKQNAGRHRNGSGSNPSPATDGEGLYVYFKSGTLARIALNGKIQWQTNLVTAYGPDTLYWDHGASPVLTRELVIMTRMHTGESWIAAFDRKSGQLKWKVARNFQTPVEGEHGYSTPLLVNFKGQEALAAWGGEHVTLHRVRDGSLIWQTECEFNPQQKPNWPTVASIVLADDVIIVPYGRADRGFPRLHGIALGNKDSAGGTEVWKRDDVGTFVPTPAVDQGKLFVLQDRGEVFCVNPRNGQILWKDAFPKASGNYYASPLIAAGCFYAIREDGHVFIAKLEPAFKIIAESDLGEHVIASPIALKNRLIIRSEDKLFCFGDPL